MNTSDLYILREGQPIDLDALRGALVIACDSERLAEAVKRDMRVSPYVLRSPDDQLEWLEGIPERAAHEYHTTCGISVVIPLHNYRAFVAETLDSVMAQTRLPEEIIVVDDASTDDSADVVHAYIEAHATDLIALIRLDRNVDVSAARNTGISLATQQHVVCLDADDMIEPRYLETLHDAMLADRSLGVTYTGVATLNQMSGEHQMISANWPPEFDWERITTISDPPYSCIPTASMFRREMWRRAGGFHQTYRAGEDIDFWLRGIATGWNVRKVSASPLFVYRRHYPSMSNTRKFTRIDHYKPWMRDGEFPFASPSSQPLAVPDYQRPVVSVVIPAGPGHAQYLPSALESVLGQTLRQWEVIVVNDTDEPLPLDAYPFARVVGHPRLGAGRARNIGVEAARAPLVCFLDADDWLMPDALCAMLDAYAVGNCSYVYTDWHQVDAAGNSEIKQSSDYDRMAMVRGGMLHPVTILVAKEDFQRYGGFDEALQGLEDWEFMAKLAYHAACGVRVARPLLAYRVHTGTQRKIGLSRRDERASLIQQRYGDLDMTKRCCGGNGNGLLAAKSALGTYVPPAHSPAPQDGKVTMEYIGSYVAPVPFLGKYVGAQTSLHKFVHAEPGDVDRLERTGHWRRAPVATSTAFDRAPEPKPAAAPVDALVKAKIERAEAIARMQDARAAAANEATRLMQEQPATEQELVKDLAASAQDNLAEVAVESVKSVVKSKRGRK